MSAVGSYDLFARKPGWKAESVLIVTPYVEGDFFQTIIGELRPKSLHVVIDDGCRREDLITVRDAIAACGHKRPPILSCKLGSAAGLVHMKLFYTRWRTAGGHVAHSLVFGSANATRQGFSGVDNAELVASARLSASRHEEIILWCRQVIEATNRQHPSRVEAARGVELTRGMHLRLPAITVGREVTTVSSFDLWLQRGRLLSSYRPDPAFLHIPVHLKKGLPQADLVKVAQGAGFTVRETKRLNYPYISTLVDSYEDEEDNEPDEELGNWRRKLFVWTHLGDWCSEATFEAHGDEFRRRGFEEREEALTQLERLLAPSDRRFEHDRFVGRLEKLWNDLGDDAPSLLHGRSKPDIRFYTAVFEERVARDLSLASDAEFRDRFLRGFEIVEVPRFRNDIAGWKGFVESLARQLVLDNARRRSQSKLLKAIQEAFKKSLVDTMVLDDHEKLVAALRDLWRRTSTEKGPAVTVARYHLL